MIEWIAGVVEAGGYGGIALLMFLENLFPPIPSELIMPMAGFTAARSDLNLWLVIAAGQAGTLLGTLPWYWLGRALGEDRLTRLADCRGRWLTVDGSDIGRATRWFRRYGAAAVLLGRLVPTIRTLISAPAGVVRMGLPRFLALSALGSLAWTTALAVAGYLLESQYARVADVVDPLSKAVIGLILLAYLYRLATWRPRKSG